MSVQAHFEAELNKRALPFEIESETGRYIIEIPGGKVFASLENLARDFDRDRDVGRISRFIDTIEETMTSSDEAYSLENLYWALEPIDYEEKAEFCEAISDRVDRVLVHLSSDGSRITWLSAEILAALGISEKEASQLAFENLARILAESSVEFTEIDEVRLGMVETSLPFKASLILAPNLREVVEASIGWPLNAVVPDRDFLYLWDSRHADFAGRVGAVVVREFNESSYPISTEVFEISDDGIDALGEFPV